LRQAFVMLASTKYTLANKCEASERLL